MRGISKRRGFLNFLLPILGLITNYEAQRKQQSAINKAGNYQDRAVALEEDNYYNTRKPILAQLRALAEGYNPAQEAQFAVDHARKTAGELASTALSANDVKRGRPMGQSSLDTARQAAVLRPIDSELAGFVANVMSNQTRMKMDALNSVIGQANGGGNLTNAYFNAARGTVIPQGGDHKDVSRIIADLINAQMAGNRGNRDAPTQDNKPPPPIKKNNNALYTKDG